MTNGPKGPFPIAAKALASEPRATAAQPPVESQLWTGGEDVVGLSEAAAHAVSDTESARPPKFEEFRPAAPAAVSGLRVTRPPPHLTWHDKINESELVID